MLLLLMPPPPWVWCMNLHRIVYRMPAQLLCLHPAHNITTATTSGLIWATVIVPAKGARKNKNKNSFSGAHSQRQTVPRYLCTRPHKKIVKWFRKMGANIDLLELHASAFLSHILHESCTFSNYRFLLLALIPRPPPLHQAGTWFDIIVLVVRCGRWYHLHEQAKITHHNLSILRHYIIGKIRLLSNLHSNQYNEKGQNCCNILNQNLLQNIRLIFQSTKKSVIYYSINIYHAISTTAQ